MAKISLGATQLGSRDLRCVQNMSAMSAHIIYECTIELFALHIAVIIVTVAQRRQVLCQFDFHAFREFLLNSNRSFIIDYKFYATGIM